MNRFVVGLSAVSSGRSAWLILGVSGIAYTYGAGAVWAIVGYTFIECLQFLYIGRRLRTQTQQYGSITLLDYLESRYNDKQHLLRITGVFIIGIFITAYVSAQLFGGAKTLSSAMNLDILWCLLISAAVILVYMILGGFVAVAYNDVVRAVIMLIGLVVLPIVGIVRIGGPSALISILKQLNPTHIDPLFLGLGVIIGYVGIGLGSPGQPHILVRYMAIDNEKKLKDAAIIGTFWNVILGLGAVSVGMLGKAFFPQVNSLPNADSEMVYLVLSAKFFGPAFYGLLVGGIFAAILSTADSQLLVVASAFVRDIYEKIWKKREVIDEKKRLVLSRYIVILSGILALILASVANDQVFWLVLFAWGGLGASFGPAIILSLYWRGTSRIGIFAGMITGIVITMVWILCFKETTGLYELVPAFFGSFVITILVSFFSRTQTMD